ncbi:hypothetical protein KU41_01230 [Clostridium botulinum]|nr:hypothetical protein KU41_01230 [Clostridium botulinum]
MPKIDNMLAILWMLSSGEKVTAKQISEKLEMNIRTVYQYIDTISSSMKTSLTVAVREVLL